MVFFFWNKKWFRRAGRQPQAARREAASMEHLVSAKSVVGAGEQTILLEVRGGSVRIKRRGAPDVFVPLDVAAEVGRFLLAAGRAPGPLARR